MKDTQEKQLFTEITTEESATVNGGNCGGYSSSSYNYNYGYRRTNYYQPNYYSRPVYYGYNYGYPCY